MNRTASVNSNTERGGADVKQVPGREIWTVTTRGNLVLPELDEGAAARRKRNAGARR